MEKTWRMPRLKTIVNTGADWLLQLLHQCGEDERLHVLMTVWRIWHVHNEITHQKSAPPVEASRRFLSSYVESLMCIRQHPKADILKGKMVLRTDHMLKQKGDFSSPMDNSRPLEKWTKPLVGWCKLNVDGAFAEADETGAAGMILRNHHDAMIFASCRFLPRCSSALEAEIAACMEGVSLTLEWSSDPFILETDSTTAVAMITEAAANRSPVASLVEETKRLLGLGHEHGIAHVRRDGNQVSHELAQMGRAPRTAVWLRHAPVEITPLCNLECDNPD